MSRPLAEWSVEERDGVLLARIEGEIDGSNAGELRVSLTERLPATGAGMVLDLSGVGFIDSSGVQLLFDLARRLNDRRQALRLVVPEGSPPRRMLELCDVVRAAPLDGTPEAALDALESS